MDKVIGTLLKRYLIAIALGNLALGSGVFLTCSAMKHAYALVYGAHPKEFASITRWALSFHWWPYLLAGIAIVIAVTLIRGRVDIRIIMHLTILLVVADGVVLFMMLVSFVLPFISTP